MRTHTKIMILLISTFFSTVGASVTLAGQCDNDWNSSSASASCSLLTQPIQTALPSDHHSDFDCVIHVSCLSGGTHPEKENNWNTREINNTTEINRQFPISFVKSIVNCNGDLRTGSCPWILYSYLNTLLISEIDNTILKHNRPVHQVIGNGFEYHKV